MKSVLALGLIASLATFGCSSSSDSEEQTPQGTGGSDAGHDSAPDTSDGSKPDAESPADAASEGPVDKDGDGWTTDADCDDADPAIHPGADEKCNGQDDDCNGQTDEGVTADGTKFHADADGDGLGDPNASSTACKQPSGYVSNDLDCDDTKGSVGAEATFFDDKDGDGYGDPGSFTKACKKPSGHVQNGDDCDDTNAAVHPGLTFYKDSDGDGFGDAAVTTVGCKPPAGYVDNALDCLGDSDPAINPAAADMPDVNGLDSNCDLVDGEVAKAIFVSVDGDDANDGMGTLALEDGKYVLTIKPVRSLAKAIELADAEDPKRYVLVSAGTYTQGIAALALREGVSVHGGYAEGFRKRELSRDAVVITSEKGTTPEPAQPTVTADAITQPLTLDRLTVRGPDLSKWANPGVASIAMRIQATDSDAITLHDVQIIAGVGSPGTDGMDGVDATPAACSRPGGLGGAGSSSGGKGAAGGNGAGSGANGGALGSSAEQCYCGTYGPDRYSADDGGDGSNGTQCTPAQGGGGASATKGSFVGLDWVAPAIGTPGTKGGDGGGGGGGGGGGRYLWCCDVSPSHTTDLAGGKGGDGGRGGCGGQGGAAATSGGLSVGLVLLQSKAVFTNTDIRLGTGGGGGKGGNGGAGIGGAPGAGGGEFAGDLEEVFMGWFTRHYYVRSGAGGVGGTGGEGCGGGGGSGGRGGWTLGIANVGNVPRTSNPTYTGWDGSANGHGKPGAVGAGGSAGPSGSGTITSESGTNGAAGQSEHESIF